MMTSGSSICFTGDLVGGRHALVEMRGRIDMRAPLPDMAEELGAEAVFGVVVDDLAASSGLKPFQCGVSVSKGWVRSTQRFCAQGV